jgi:hypothetical protein
MFFVVKVIGQSRTAWLSAPTPEGIRTLDTRKMADVFEGPEDARIAVEKMPPAFIKGGFVFSIESADDWNREPA